MAGKRTPEMVKRARLLEKRARAVLDNYEKNPESVRFGKACAAFADDVNAVSSEICANNR